MAEEKPYEPTQSRIERAKREGDVARSQEIGNVAALACGLGAAAAVVPALGAVARTMLGGAAAARIEYASAFAGALLTLVPIACAAAGAVAANAVQSGGLRFVAIAIKADRLSPGENVKRIFSRESAVTAVRATVGFLCAAAAIVPVFGAVYAGALHGGGVVAIASEAWSGALHTAAVACIVGGAFAAADYGVQAVRWKKKLRMSFEELKRDQKESDGDPQARSRRRSLHRQLARGSLQRVKDAAFVVTNPTHIAIAMEYRPPDVPVPRILVRAAGETAARVRELAAAHGVPLVENVALARLLYATARPGEFIPQETYVAVAEIVAALGRIAR